MLKIQKLSVTALLVSAVISAPVFADNKADADFDTQASYAVGVLFGSELRAVVKEQSDVIRYNNEKVLAGVADVLNGKVELANNAELLKTLETTQNKLRAAAEKKRAELEAKAKADGEKFRTDFVKKDGVKTTKSGLLYHVTAEGKGETIKPTDTVKVHYTGKLPDGTVFDSSVERGQPVEFKLNQVIAGWTEGLQLVKKGGKIELVIPPELGYGEQGAGSIPPNSMLYFDVEVLDVNPTAKK